MTTFTTVNGVDVSPPPSILVTSKKSKRRLVMLPEVATKALEIAKDPECKIEDFTSLVGRDVKLASDVLKMSNSILFSPRTPIINLERAVVRIGFRECQNLILANSVASIMSKSFAGHEARQATLWRHSLNTGILATHFNRSFKLDFHGEEFTAGIIHDIGRAIFGIFCPEDFVRIDPMHFDESAEIQQIEGNLIGTDHCRLGAWFAIENGLPHPIAEVILRHHRPQLARNESRKLTALISVVDHMSNYVQRTGSPVGYDPDLNPGLPILAGIIPLPAGEAFREKAFRLMQEAERDTNSMLAL